MQQPSKANATALFEGRKHYVIPAYQRPYVWNEEDQWSPLWDDIVRVSESYMGGTTKQLESHFLGAVVFELVQASSAGITELSVIDGQQRLTTLQILLDAIRQILARLGHNEQAEQIEELTRNKQSVYKGKAERFKLWPSQANRAEFSYAMDPEGEKKPPSFGQIQGAHDFFSNEATRWLKGMPDADGAAPLGNQSSRAAQLTETLVSRLVVVAIDLTGDDDAQLIFETLNDRGTPLLKADLIKNWIFRRGQHLGADVDSWSRNIWEDFDTGWWRDEIIQGRLSRSRVDIFLHYWLTMRVRDEVKLELIFRRFTEHASLSMTDTASAEKFLKELRSDADTYRGLEALSIGTTAGRFRARVIEAMELAATTPIFLWVISKNHRLSDTQIEVGLNALESWVVRRTLLKMTSKDINKLVVALLKVLAAAPIEIAGDAIRIFLSQQTASTREWPTDDRFIEEISTLKIYGNVKQGRIAEILGAIEAYKRSKDLKYGAVSLPPKLTVEHVMPQKWREHWRPSLPLSIENEQKRDKIVQTLGNLTLVTQSLNSYLSNRPWTDAEAKILDEGGLAGKGKWHILDQFNLLVLNKELLQNTEAWTESDIATRSKNLARVIAEIWPGPIDSVREAAENALLGA